LVAHSEFVNNILDDKVIAITKDGVTASNGDRHCCDHFPLTGYIHQRCRMGGGANTLCEWTNEQIRGK